MITARFADKPVSPQRDIGRPILVNRARKRERFFCTSSSLGKSRNFLKFRLLKINKLLFFFRVVQSLQ